MLSDDERIAASVAVNGWHAVSVGDQRPPFVYTCGLMTSFSHPELIIFGMDPSVAYSVFQLMVEDIRAGKLFANRGLYDDVLARYPVALREVHPTQHELYLGYAMGHCRLKGMIGGLRALQVFWCDHRGLFPFQSDCEAEVSRLQPRLDQEVAPSELREFRRKWFHGNNEP